MENIEYKKSNYRWVILLVMMPILAMTNIFWLTFAPISEVAKNFYGVSSFAIAFLSMSYMIVYILATIPASYVVDTMGFKASMTIGAVMTAGFGMLRGVYSQSFTIVVIAQLGVAIGQPFLVNSITKAAAKWFPVEERATASGLATMAGYVGMIIAMVLTPTMQENVGLVDTLLTYGYASIVCAFLFIIFAKEEPNTLPGPAENMSEKLSFKEIKVLMRKSNFIYLMLCMFIVMGIFNAVMTCIEDILAPRGITSNQAGLIGGVLVIVGLIGAVVIPMISDKLRKRVPLLIWPLALAIPAFIGLSFFTNYSSIMIAAAIAGFVIMGMGPVAFQYGAEIAYPVPEGTSFGLLMVMGQISGILFICFMYIFRFGDNPSMLPSLIVFIFLMLLALFIVSKLKESALLSKDKSSNEMKLAKTIKAKGLKPTIREKLEGKAIRKAIKKRNISKAKIISKEEINKVAVEEGITKENLPLEMKEDLLIGKKKEVIAIGILLLEKGLVSGTWGNVSSRVNEEYMVITPSGIPYEEITLEQVVLVNIKNLSYEGKIKPSGELAVHAAIYVDRPKINFCIHTHSMNASTVAAARRDVPPILDDMAQILGPSVRVTKYGLPGSKKLARTTVEAIKNRNAALLANHGAVCIGRNATEAFVACEILEKACKAFIESEFLGGAKAIGDFDATVMHQYYLMKYSKQKER